MAMGGRSSVVRTLAAQASTWVCFPAASRFFSTFHFTNVITILSIQALIGVRLADSELSAYIYSYWTAQEKLIGD